MVYYKYKLLIYLHQNDRNIISIHVWRSNKCKWPPYLLEQVTKYVSYTGNAGDMELNINQLTHNNKLCDVRKLTPKEDDKLNVMNTLYCWTPA